MKMSTEAPKRDIASVEAPADTSEPEEGKKTARKNWTEFKGVVESSKIDTIDRLDIVVGVNEYKGNHFVFLAKVTDAGFQRAFMSMPAYVWQKTIPVLQGYASRIGEIEKTAMAKAVVDELKRLKELGIDIKALADQV